MGHKSWGTAAALQLQRLGPGAQRLSSFCGPAWRCLGVHFHVLDPCLARLLLQVKTLVPPISQSGKVAGEVTQIAASPTANQVAVGHADGTVRSAAPAPLLSWHAFGAHGGYQAVASG